MSYVWLGYINKLEVDVGSEGMELSRLRLERGRSDGSEALFSVLYELRAPHARPRLQGGILS
jgi:hypothetical protein